MLQKTLSVAAYGIDANIIQVKIQVEVDCFGTQCDQDHFHTVSRPDAAVRESPDRVGAALKNCGCDIPPRTSLINPTIDLAINLAPTVGWKPVSTVRIARDILRGRSMDWFAVSA